MYLKGVVKFRILILCCSLMFCLDIRTQTVSDSVPNFNTDSLISFSKQFIGTKYRYATCNPKLGFDCSGFVYYVYSQFGIKVPRSSYDFNRFGVKIPRDSCKSGDVIVFTGTNAANRSPGHVGIIISNINNEIRFIHSSSNKKHSGVKISSFKESPYYEKRFLKIVRIPH